MPKRPLLVFSLAALGCGSASPAMAPVTQLDGEIHLHQFPLGAHAWAGFIADPVPLGDVHSDQLVEIQPDPTLTDGACALYVQPTCAPECAGASYCAATNRCAPLVPLIYVDGGEIDVTGSSLVPKIRMWFDGGSSSYLAEPEPGATLLFAGGERLEFFGGSGEFALSGTLEAPAPVAVLAPSLDGDLHLPRDAALEVRWTPAAGASIVVSLSASSQTTGSGFIRCVTADVGSLTVPRAMMAGLPGPPRSTRLEVERDEEDIFPTHRATVGVLVHASQSTWKNGSD